jgi:excisionase family DNA binding protein
MATDQPSYTLTVDEAAALLGVSSGTIEGLVSGGYLAAVPGDPGRALRLSDLKAFMARNAESGAGASLVTNLEDIGSGLERSSWLVDALDGHAMEMARRVYDIFAGAFPEAASWSTTERANFIGQAKARFEAILAVISQGAEVDEALGGELRKVGAHAAWSGAPLPQLLVVLRISRDVMVQTAVELAELQNRVSGLGLSLFLTRVLPAMDRLTDSLAQGYWGAASEGAGDAAGAGDADQPTTPRRQP